VKRLLRWLLALVGLAGVVALVLVGDTWGATLACGRVPARVRGVVVDTTTGAPVEGALLFALADPETARDPKALEEWRARYDDRSREDLLRYPRRAGSAHTDAAGAFDIVVALGTWHYRGNFGLRENDYRENASDVARALLVEKEGYDPIVFETKDARWIERREGRIVGTLEMGTIRLARR
jgi:hypothetical protein